MTIDLVDNSEPGWLLTRILRRCFVPRGELGKCLVAYELVLPIEEPCDASENRECDSTQNAAKLPVMVAVQQHVNDLYGLFFHVLFRRAILNHEVRELALLVDRHLRYNSLLGFRQREVVAVHQSCDLNIFFGRHANYLVDIINQIGVHFEQERQLEHDEILPEEEILEDFLVNRPMDDGVSESVQDSSFLNVVEYDLPKFVTVQRLVFVEDFIAKVLFDLLPDWLVRFHD